MHMYAATGSHWVQHEATTGCCGRQWQTAVATGSLLAGCHSLAGELQLACQALQLRAPEAQLAPDRETKPEREERGVGG